MTDPKTEHAEPGVDEEFTDELVRLLNALIEDAIARGVLSRTDTTGDVSLASEKPLGDEIEPQQSTKRGESK